MANVVEQRKFSKTDLGKNNNKYWNVTLFDNDDVQSHFGRQGEDGQTKLWTGKGRSFYDSKIREKFGKGYRENQTIENLDNSPDITVKTTIQNSSLTSIALSQIKTSCKIVQDLIKDLVKVNAHQIANATGGKITYDSSTAQFKTTQGVVVPVQVSEARDLLDDLAIMVASNDWGHPDFEYKLNHYLSLIPRDFGRARRSPQSIFPDLAKIQNETLILDGLAASFNDITTNGNKTGTKSKSKKDDSPKLFDVTMEIVDDKSIISFVRNLYQSTRKAMHQSNNLAIQTVYKVEIADMKNSYDKYGNKLNNKMQLWHGTKASNLLSILKKGLIIPPTHSSYVTGRLYGNGLYFSSISTKSLNYATNFWGGGGNVDRTFMFLSDVAMGNYYLAGNNHGSNYPVRGYDSTWAKGGQAGVINDEMIVYRLDQANLVYLVEFIPR